MKSSFNPQRKENVMLAKYHIEFTVPLRKQAPTNNYTTDDPVA